MAAPGDFFNLYRHNFVRVAVATPLVRLADPAYNAEQTLALMRQAARAKAIVAVFPELGLTAYSAEDLFHQQALIRGAEAALATLLAGSRGLPVAAFVGLPVLVDGLLYNCAALILRGRICQSVWVASTCRFSDWPIPKAMAPSAPWVLVWLSPQTSTLPGSVMPCSGPTTCTMPCLGSLRPKLVKPVEPTFCSY